MGFLSLKSLTSWLEIPAMKRGNVFLTLLGQGENLLFSRSNRDRAVISLIGGS